MINQTNLLKDLLQLEREVQSIHSQGLIANKEIDLLKAKKLELSKHATIYGIIDSIIKLSEDGFISLNIEKWN